MKKTYSSRSRAFLVTAILYITLTVPSLKVQAQSEPFNCDFNAYLFQYNDMYAIDLASGSSYLVAENLTEGNINAAAYNTTDGYIWGYLSSPQTSIVRIGKNFQTDVYTIPNLPNNGNKYVGDISNDGIYYIRAGGSAYYAIDLNPESNDHLGYLGSYTLSKNINIHDWAFNALDGKLYTVEKKTNRLYRVDAVTGLVEDMGEVPILSGLNYTFGAVYFDVEGNFYVSANQTGAVYIINSVQTIETEGIRSNIFAFGPSSSLNDGARCPTAPVPQEDCINGVDDDGDGLVDCDDPACSGVSNCPTLKTSSANKGGLESNDRLASLISKRNYQRAKTNYEFNPLTAKQLKKGANYKKTGKYPANQIPLVSLVPLGIVGETSTVESSPSDLLALTNASDIYSVDYLRNDETISALMVIKTDNEVYEHSKFICDRFLGAELLSVSTISIREHHFIKSIIKQPDGSTEFALTFSARLDNEGRFIVESHWNIDAYADNTAFYNFQIWSNTIDDLVRLGEEIVSLLEVNAPIGGYESSNPPPVFVKSARYQKGGIELLMVNNNFSDEVYLEGGIKRTETSETEQVTYRTAIDGYIAPLKVTTGALFDFGFRIENGKGDTPDDLFVADAPWGLDDTAVDTNAEEYQVEINDGPYTGEGYRVERNVRLKGSTADYIGVYRAFSPRFIPVDLSEYGSLVFEAKGTGMLDVKVLKGDGSTFVKQVGLTEENQTFRLKATDFLSDATANIDFSSMKVLSFEMRSNDGSIQEKTLAIENIEFTNQEPGKAFVIADTKRAVVMPNPMRDTATVYFYGQEPGTYTFDLFSSDGKIIGTHHFSGNTQLGQNELVLSRKGLGSGLYFYKIKSNNDQTWTGKILVP